MGASAGAEIDAWLRDGGLVVTASERAARGLASAFHRTRLAEGLKAWNAPGIQDWNSFVRSAWAARTLDGRLLLNPTQEQALWAEVATAEGRLATLLEGPRYRLAAMAMDAHELLCSHAPRYLRASARAGWQNDAAAFSQWLSAFDETCRTDNLLSPARLPTELLRLLQEESTNTGVAERSPLLLAGFDRILPVQRAVFDAWGDWREAAPGEVASTIRYYEARDDYAEMEACARWCSNRLSEHPHRRLLVVTQDVTTRRGQIERAFLDSLDTDGSPPFEFSLGVPLNEIALPRASHLLLRWLAGALAEYELDWLFSSGFVAASALETAALQAHMRTLRNRGLQQPSWTLQGFIKTFPGRFQDGSPARVWLDRMTRVQRRLNEFARHPQTPLYWAELVPQLLEDSAWPGERALSSAEFQAARRRQQALENAGSLGFDGRHVSWKDFLSALGRTLEETLFAPESRDAPIQIAGPAESAGLTADGVWFLGASEGAWPAGGSTHPLLPPEVQRETRMPHATAQLDWDLAQAVTTRLISCAREVCFSYAKQMNGLESRPSRVIGQVAGVLQPLPEELIAVPGMASRTVAIEDFTRIPFPPRKIAGGAGVLTAQSQCPFKAFATTRLAARSWEPATAGLAPAQRGQFLHDVLHSLWAGPPDGIRNHADLLALTDRRAFVSGHVQRIFATKLRPALRERMPARYLELEQLRLTRLVTEWLSYEAARVPFDVVETEAEHTVELGGLQFDLRLDRLDRLNDGSVLVIDYKSGDVSQRSWEMPRPDDVQLPLYASFALEEEQVLGGLVFAKLRAGDLGFSGCVGNPSATLIPGLKNSTPLARNALTAEKLLDWRECIEQLARDFLAGRAEADPRDYPKTCERCGLQTLCRIEENRAAHGDDKENDDAEADDE